MSIDIRNFGLTYYSYSLYDVTFFNDSIKTLVTHTPCIVDTWISDIKRLHHHRLRNLVVGLDAEWRPDPNNQTPVATLQLCVGRNCLVFKILMAPEIPQNVADFLLDVDFTFVGVGIENDAQKLFDDYGLQVSNRVDLRSLAAGRLNDAELFHAGLVRLAGDVLGLNFQKSKNVTLSDWDADWLSDDQILYACVDAFVSFEIGRYLNAGN